MKSDDQEKFIKALSPESEGYPAKDKEFREQAGAQTPGELPSSETEMIGDIAQYTRETTIPENSGEDVNTRSAGGLEFEIIEQFKPIGEKFDTLVAKSEGDKKFCTAFNQLTGHVFASPDKNLGDNSLVIVRENSQNVIRELNDPAFRRNVQVLLDKIIIEKDKKRRSEELLTRLRAQLKSTLEEKQKILEELREQLSSMSKKREKISVLKEQIQVYDKEITHLRRDIEIRAKINDDLAQTTQARIKSIENLAVQVGETAGLKRHRSRFDSQ